MKTNKEYKIIFSVRVNGRVFQTTTDPNRAVFLIQFLSNQYGNDRVTMDAERKLTTVHKF